MTEHFTQAEAVAFAHTYLPKPHTDRELTAMLNAAAEKGRAALLEELGKVEPFGLFCGTTDKGGFFGSLLTKDVPPEKCHLFARPLPAQDVNEHKPNCKECAKWVQEQADNREWIEGVAKGKRIVEKLAAKELQCRNS